MTRIRVIDLFAGAGGFSLAARLARVSVGVLVEIDPTACATLRLNRDHARSVVVEADIAEIGGAQLRRLAGATSRDVVLVVGGAPCQPFSKAAYWTEPGDEARFRQARSRGESVVKPKIRLRPRPDARRDLVKEFWRIVIETRADGFVFENVPSILHPRNRPVIERLMRSAEKAGFLTTLVRANAVEFGVPQRRERVFLLGARGIRPVAPRSTHAGSPSEVGPRLPAPVDAKTVLRAFAARRYFEPEEIVTGRWAKHLATVPPGWNYKAHTAWAGHPKPTFVTETRFWNFLLKLSPDLPSWTIPANPGPWTGPFHWRNRRLRTPELATLQGFPGDYRFAGTRRERVRQIGNAVPPPLAAAMIKEVVRAVRASHRRNTRARSKAA